ncbi:restriction modification system DNA specificity domain [Vibrio sp. B1ASS3]|uniref:restriction endonuclease subunit S n=1 Tax=Vibrio sp. B1ASS3 TaxID=2751176 RepID=UPI001ABAD71C|nr:restriction endonuclease subunit S [Vibrio sp. B1ASS3]CAD7803302.1 restriction modification system DNA specificity domain [Vibrio sp. B1ASS3]CAE6894553.1 restriction modification system DNA specificity domain [Vibrio sp. B1ASS3]
MVPNGWVDGRVGDLLLGLESGVSVNGEDRPLEQDEKGVLKVSAVSYGVFRPNAAKAITSATELARAKVNPKQGQIIISRSNTEELVGASAYIDGQYDNLFLPDKLWQTVPKLNSNMKWLSYLLSSEHCRYTLSNLATGTSGSMKNITKGELLSLKIGIPPLPEQRKIAQVLSTWDKAIATTEKLIDASKQQKKSLMQQLLTGKKRLLDPETGKAFEEEWAYVQAGSIFATRSNKKHNSDLPILAITQDQGAVPRELIDYNVSVTQGSIAGYKVVEIGDFIISLRSFQGGIEYSKYKGICSPAYVILHPKIEISDDFYKYHLKSFSFIQAMKSRLEGIRDGKIISYKYFSEIKLPQPSLKEQEKIASVLTAADKEIELLEAKLAYFKQEKKALMQQLLTGKRRVKVAKTEAA